MRQLLGYFLGFAIFIALIPALMWWVSGMPSLGSLPVGRLYLAALLVFAVVATLMVLQVRSEEKRLEADFGEEYLAYKKRTGRFITL